MSADWVALAYAVEPSDRTFAATAALTGAATFALRSDMAARSGSSSPAISFSSSRVSWRYCWMSSVIDNASLVGLRDRGRLLRVRVGDRVVRRHVQRQRGVDGRGDVRVDQRHRGALRQLLAGHFVQLLTGELAVLLDLFLSHGGRPPSWSGRCRRTARRPRTRPRCRTARS